MKKRSHKKTMLAITMGSVLLFSSLSAQAHWWDKWKDAMEAGVDFIAKPFITMVHDGEQMAAHPSISNFFSLLGSIAVSAVDLASAPLTIGGQMIAGGVVGIASLAGASQATLSTVGNIADGFTTGGVIGADGMLGTATTIMGDEVAGGIMAGIGNATGDTVMAQQGSEAAGAGLGDALAFSQGMVQSMGNNVGTVVNWVANVGSGSHNRVKVPKVPSFANAAISSVDPTPLQRFAKQYQQQKTVSEKIAFLNKSRKNLLMGITLLKNNGQSPAEIGEVLSSLGIFPGYGLIASGAVKMPAPPPVSSTRTPPTSIQQAAINSVLSTLPASIKMMQTQGYTTSQLQTMLTTHLGLTAEQATVALRSAAQPMTYPVGNASLNNALANGYNAVFNASAYGKLTPKVLQTLSKADIFSDLEKALKKSNAWTNSSYAKLTPEGLKQLDRTTVVAALQQTLSKPLNAALQVYMQPFFLQALKKVANQPAITAGDKVLKSKAAFYLRSSNPVNALLIGSPSMVGNVLLKAGYNTANTTWLAGQLHQQYQQEFHRAPPFSTLPAPLADIMQNGVPGNGPSMSLYFKYAVNHYPIFRGYLQQHPQAALNYMPNVHMNPQTLAALTPAVISYPSQLTLSSQTLNTALYNSVTSSTLKDQVMEYNRRSSGPFGGGSAALSNGQRTLVDAAPRLNALWTAIQKVAAGSATTVGERALKSTAAQYEATISNEIHEWQYNSQPEGSSALRKVRLIQGYVGDILDKNPSFLTTVLQKAGYSEGNAQYMDQQFVSHYDAGDGGRAIAPLLTLPSNLSKLIGGKNQGSNYMTYLNFATTLYPKFHSMVQAHPSYALTQMSANGVSDMEQARYLIKVGMSKSHLQTVETKMNKAVKKAFGVGNVKAEDKKHNVLDLTTAQWAALPTHQELNTAKDTVKVYHEMNMTQQSSSQGYYRASQ